MRAVAARAGVGRSTLSRHFDGLEALRSAVPRATLATAAQAVERAAEPRGVVNALVEVGAPAACVEGCEMRAAPRPRV